MIQFEISFRVWPKLIAFFLGHEARGREDGNRETFQVFFNSESKDAASASSFRWVFVLFLREARRSRMEPF
jgi:hypothetical protein